MSRIKNFLNKIPFSWAKKSLPNNVMGGYYHLATEDRLPYVEHLYPYKTPKQLREDLIFLKKNFPISSYSDYLKYPEKKQFILTFDDGFSSLKNDVLPILEELNIPAIFFITTAIIDNKEMMHRNIISLIIDELLNNEELFSKHKDALERLYQTTFSNQDEFIKTLRKQYNNVDFINENAQAFGLNLDKYLADHKPYLTSEEILELSKHPLVKIGAHSTQHFLYKTMSPDLIKQDIINSAKYIQSITKEEEIPFAFPFTSAGVDRNILVEINNEHPWIKGFFGEFNADKNDKLVVKRFPLDNPNLSAQQKIHKEIIELQYKKIKKWT